MTSILGTFRLVLVTMLMATPHLWCCGLMGHAEAGVPETVATVAEQEVSHGCCASEPTPPAMPACPTSGESEHGQGHDCPTCGQQQITPDRSQSQTMRGTLADHLPVMDLAPVSMALTESLATPSPVRFEPETAQPRFRGDSLRTLSCLLLI